jgi:putative glutamine amidotransferase
VRIRVAIPTPHSTNQEHVTRSLPQYKAAIEQAGGEALVIPLDRSNDEIARLSSLCHAVLLPGSPADVDPEKYGEAVRHPKTAPGDPPRDNTDELLLQDAFNIRKPILGICYGLQSLNVWRTGTLIQHLDTPVNHAAGSKVPRAHGVHIEAESRLAGIVQAGLLRVNSSHHQAAVVPGDGLRVVARCPEDGVIEALEGTAPEHFVVAVQWHPERMIADDEPARALFRALVQAARTRFAGARVPDFETAVK